ncbi:phage tail assembly protein [Micromonospora sp. NBC_01813]|uniref:phage tail assembly protein n=1 Tax=Micromonospora sp. NBC_01813 TaxID=2975988 RepID=UPI002DDAA77E|nr:phage tail assembly protein [Micromonospora sp. NBC_01813]WSA11554.1 phage tail assembly protein [Micromonospora sp. NBC_01813]
MKLDDIRAAAEAKYGSLPIEVGDTTVVLLNALRLPKAKRDKISALQDDLKAEGADQEAIMRELIRLAANTKAGGELLIKGIGDDLTVLAETLAEYGKKTRVGEASA